MKDDSANSEFTLDSMTRQTASLSPDSDKLVLGGSLAIDEHEGYSAIAQVNLSDNSVDFARQFALARTISSIAYQPSSSTTLTDT